jgi:3-oxoacyl-[acyl-carrier protein] reductase
LQSATVFFAHDFLLSRCGIVVTASLEGKRALVGGGSKGIGLGCAIALAEAGVEVTLMARDTQTLNAAIESVPRPLSQTHRAISVDFADWKAVAEAAATDIRSNGPVEIVVNNTGGPAPGLAIDADPIDFEAWFGMHLITGQALVQTVIPGMKESRYGRIINIISSSVVTPLPNLGVSNTIRGAVAQWGKTLAAELAPFGITVNNVLPGSIDTSRLRVTMARNAERTGTPVSQIEARTIEAIPMGRLGEPADVGRVVAFLASPAAAYVTGVNLPVDGGKLAIQ